MNGDVHSELATLEFNNVEQLEDFHIIIIRLQQETLSPTRLLLKYIQELSKSNKRKELIDPNMTDLIKLFDNNRKLAVYTGGNIHGLYHYIKMIGYTTTLTTSVQSSHHFGP